MSVNKYLAKQIIKRTIYLGLSLLAKYSGIAALLRLLRGRDGLIVLMYHKVNDIPNNPLTVTIHAFEEQIRHLTANYKIVSLDEVARTIEGNRKFGKRSVLITFDDGYQDNLTNAYPILVKYRCGAVLFIPTDYPGDGLLPHDQRLPFSNPILTWEQIAAMEDVFEIGSHGRSHRALTKIPFRDAKHEIESSKALIEQKLGRPVRSFSYPKGSILDFNDALEEVVRACDYQVCFTTIPGRNTGHFSRWRVRRYHVENFGMIYFRCLLDGCADIVGIKDTKFGYKAKQLFNRMIGIEAP